MTASSPSTGTNSSGSSSLQSCENNHDQQQITMVDVKKRKRMLSNRESARRSRMRKQKQLDDLVAQVANLRAENYQILRNTNLAKQMCQKVESENTVLRAQMSELNQRLQSLNDIVNYMSSSNNDVSAFSFDHHHHQSTDELGDFDGGLIGDNNYDDFLSPDWNIAVHVNNQPMIYLADVFMC